MKAYLVKRMDDIGYDEVDSMVIVAKSETDAKNFSATCAWGDWAYDASKLDIKPIILSGNTRVILSSFNAG